MEQATCIIVRKNNFEHWERRGEESLGVRKGGAPKARTSTYRALKVCKSTCGALGTCGSTCASWEHKEVFSDHIST